MKKLVDKDSEVDKRNGKRKELSGPVSSKSKLIEKPMFHVKILKSGQNR